MSTPSSMPTEAECALLQALHKQLTEGYLVDAPTLQLIRDHVTTETQAWRECAQRVDAKMLTEQADHNKTVDKLIAANALIARLRQALVQHIAWYETPTGDQPDALLRLNAVIREALAATPETAFKELQYLRTAVLGGVDMGVITRAWIMVYGDHFSSESIREYTEAERAFLDAAVKAGVKWESP